MIDKPLLQITHEDIERLVAERFPEGKTLDYKRDTYGNKDEDKKELLKDVSSLANTQGGDILIGVDEDKGLPTGIPGVTVSDIDKEKLRLDEIIRRGLDPRIEFGIHSVLTPVGTTVIVIRVRDSLLSPHRVTFQGKFGEFWARSSAGKYSMDTDELRRAFTLSAGINDRIKAFRAERVAKIKDGDTPVRLEGSGRLVLHLIPVSAFRSRQFFSVTAIGEKVARFPPPDASGWDYRLNLDGLLTFSGGEAHRMSRSYTQLYRNGVVETVLADVTRDDPQRGKLLLAGYYERVLMRDLPQYLSGLRQFGLNPTVWGFLSLTGVKGARIPSQLAGRDEHLEVDRDTLLLPEFLIDDLEAKASTLLRPTLDLIWNSAGYSHSVNFDEKGEWVGPAR